jgi:hypothetical protein
MGQEERLELSLREYRPGDELAILTAFNEVFGQNDPSFRPRSLETWRWQFLGNPHGWRIWLGLDGEGRVIGQQASLPVRMQVGEETMCWSQVVDSFSDPRYGRGLKRKGVYATTARGHSDHYGGEPPERDPIMYGMPVRPAWRIGRLYLDYEVCRSQDALWVDPERFRAAAAPGVEVEEVALFPADVEELFARASKDHGALAVRDAAYMNWRFVERPEHAYRLALARGAGGRCIGLAVYRGAAFDGHESGLICDWLVPRREVQAGRALRAWLAGCACSEDRRCLAGIWPESCADWGFFQRAGYRVRPTQYYNVICQYTARFDIRWLYWKWYYTLGDFDLC